jgi:hypothetical protein
MLPVRIGVLGSEPVVGAAANRRERSRLEVNRERGKRYVTLGGVFLAAALWLGAVPSPQAATIPPGFDLFETNPQDTTFSFQPPLAPNGTEIPPGFFGPGSDAFTGQVSFGGVPLQAFNGYSIGDADTVVQRPSAADTSSGTPVPIQLVRLSLVSMEPITVTYNGGQNPELWNVSAAPSQTRPSQGQIQINQNGTFNSFLNVLPQLTFTRLSDGTQRSFDASQLSPTTQQQLTFFSQNVPWSLGCVLPALSVPGLNDGFCPSFQNGRKVFTVEKALLAQHGVIPAQPQLEHFRCYQLFRQPFTARKVQLSDQFGSRTAKVTNRAELCNPAQKNSEPFFNGPAHQVCYSTTGPPVNRVVAVQNQFGSQRLLVGAPRRLCVPSQKQQLRATNLVGVRLKPKAFPKIAVPIDHYQCYGVTALTPIRARSRPGAITLTDEFGKDVVALGNPFQICAPAQKTLGKRLVPIQHPVQHLVCYATKSKPVRRLVAIRNQFETRLLLTKRPVALCVPSNKLLIGP